MTIDLSRINEHHRLLFAVPLVPVQGKRFQPTGFPDLGAATYETPDGLGLLVESAQSMANRLEGTCWDEARQDLVSKLTGLSYVRVLDPTGAFLTSSVLEAHRLNSVYIEKAEGGFHAKLEEEIGVSEKKPLDRRRFVQTIFKYDAGSLVHGIFLESIDGRLRIARALTAFIEAEGATVAASGGVKNDRVQPGKSEGQGAKEGFGNVPFHRDEYVAQSITLYANVDLAQLRGYGLPEPATRMLVYLCLYKLRAFVDGKLRLRTACDLALGKPDVVSTNVDRFVLPGRIELEEAVKAGIEECKSMFGGENGVTKVTFKT